MIAMQTHFSNLASFPIRSLSLVSYIVQYLILKLNGKMPVLQFPLQVFR